MACIVDVKGMDESIRKACSEAIRKGKETGIYPAEVEIKIPTRGTLEYIAVEVNVEK